MSVDASSWSAYGGGVLSYAACGTAIDHAVMMVGYGTDPVYGELGTHHPHPNPPTHHLTLPTTTPTPIHPTPPPPHPTTHHPTTNPRRLLDDQELVGLVVGRGRLHSHLA